MIKRARVVDQDVDRAELLDDALDRLADLGPAGDVALAGRSSPPHGGDLLGGRLRVDEALRPRRLRDRPVALRLLPRVRLDLDVGDHYVRPGAAERQGVRTTQAPRAAGDERDPAGKVDLERHVGAS